MANDMEAKEYLGLVWKVKDHIKSSITADFPDGKFKAVVDLDSRDGEMLGTITNGAAAYEFTLSKGDRPWVRRIHKDEKASGDRLEQSVAEDFPFLDIYKIFDRKVLRGVRLITFVTKGNEGFVASAKKGDRPWVQRLIAQV